MTNRQIDDIIKGLVGFMGGKNANLKIIPT